MFTAEEMKELEAVASQAENTDVTCSDEICNAMSSGCSWG